MSQLRVLDEREIDADLDRRIKIGLCRCFPADVETFSKTRAWHGSVAAYTVLMEEDGVVVGHVGVVRREIFVSGAACGFADPKAHDSRSAKPQAAAMTIAGIQNVFIVPEKRGTGLLEPLMRQAMSEAHRRQYDAGLLFCLPGLEKVYAQLGWQTIHPVQVHAARSTGEQYVLDDKNLAMFYPVMMTQFPPGEIDLNGDDW